MFNSKYSKILTAVLAVVIAAIVGTVGYVVYDTFVVSAKRNQAQQMVEEFAESTAAVRRYKDTTSKDNTVENSGTGTSTNPLESIENVETIQPEQEKVYMEGYEMKGTIRIEKTGVNLPILSEVTKKSLETSVAILYGVGLNQVGNTTIAGHNYRNGLFFSDNKKLAKGDKIEITDQEGVTITYIIYDTFTTTPSDAEYMRRDTNGAREISLSTCTDDAKQRLIILAKEQ